MTKQIDIKKLIPYIFCKGYIACSEAGNWCFYFKKPKINYRSRIWENDSHTTIFVAESLNIKPAEDWTKSLMKVGGK